MPDINSENRKKDHIALAFKAQMSVQELDPRFYYEPMLSGHPKAVVLPQRSIGNYVLRLPMWISSMTGGTEKAASINTNLAKAAQKFGIGMGLGSCRPLLEGDERLEDFAVKHLMPDAPLYANIGIAQLQELQETNKVSLLKDMVNKLDADGLILHINPMQEWMQPEGDRYYTAPIDSIRRLIEKMPDLALIVKEVGQGMGPKSLKALYELPLAAVDFAASGGTNFALLELLRSEDAKAHADFCNIGHGTSEMIHLANDILDTAQTSVPTTIISGGISNYLDGYYALELMKYPAIYGQASAFLRPALHSYEALEHYITAQKEGLEMAYTFLTLKHDYGKR